MLEVRAARPRRVRTNVHFAQVSKALIDDRSEVYGSASGHLLAWKEVPIAVHARSRRSGFLLHSPLMTPLRDEQSDDPGTISSTLLERVKAGDEEGWRRMVVVYAPLAYRWCRTAGFQEHDASDMVQEVFQSVLRHLPSFRRDRPSDSFRAWLRTITVNKMRDAHRRRGTQPQPLGGTDAQTRVQQLAESAPGDADDSAGGESDLIHRLLELIRPEIEPRTWEAFWRATVLEHTAGEIAADLAMTPHAVRQAKYRVLQRLRREFAELPENGA
jgi:RNA polymerase sigma-70 factor (ECF subfamily)